MDRSRDLPVAVPAGARRRPGAPLGRKHHPCQTRVARYLQLAVDLIDQPPHRAFVPPRGGGDVPNGRAFRRLHRNAALGSRQPQGCPTRSASTRKYGCRFDDEHQRCYAAELRTSSLPATAMDSTCTASSAASATVAPRSNCWWRATKRAFDGGINFSDARAAVGPGLQADRRRRRSQEGARRRPREVGTSDRRVVSGPCRTGRGSSCGGPSSAGRRSRKTPEIPRDRAPLPGLYLYGAGRHPGGEYLRNTGTQRRPGSHPRPPPDQ